MSYRLSDIKHETRSYFVLSVGDKGYEVYEKGPTAATRIARIGHGDGPALGIVRAIAECERRQSLADVEHDIAAAKCKGGA